MDERGEDAKFRPLARSLDPLAGESLGGYLLRLASRLRVAPFGLARMTGCIATPRTSLSRRLLLHTKIADFARATRLTQEEARSLTLLDWAHRYPPIARSLSPDARRADGWLFNHTPRFCPHCLAGDESPLQQQYGGPWKKEWHLPVSFACIEHQILLHDDCPRGHPPLQGTHPLIAQGTDDTLHPAQCRHPRPGASGRQGRSRPSCGARLDHAPDPGFSRPSPDTLDTQRRILEHLDPGHPAKTAARFFTDLRIITALLCSAWPLDRHLIEPAAHTAVDEHVRALGSPGYRVVDKPPDSVTAAAALLTAATTVLDDDTRQTALVQSLRESRTGRPSREPWVDVFTRHAASCSPALHQTIEPFTRAFQRTGYRGSRAPAHTHRYRAEHIPAFLEQAWHLEHLAHLDYGPHVKIARRLAAAQLVQWAAGGSIGAAAHYLGFNPTAGQYAPSPGLYQRLTELGQQHFEAALHALARDLDNTPDLIDYHRRRTRLRDWHLTSEEWQHIVERLPPVPGPIQPVLDDRKRQEASAIIWAHITQGEPRFAPRPIEADQPDPIRREWQLRHGPTVFQFTRRDPLGHYAALGTLLTQHARDLARRIDSGAGIG